MIAFYAQLIRASNGARRAFCRRPFTIIQFHFAGFINIIVYSFRHRGIIRDHQGRICRSGPGLAGSLIDLAPVRGGRRAGRPGWAASPAGPGHRAGVPGGPGVSGARPGRAPAPARAFQPGIWRLLGSPGLDTAPGIRRAAGSGSRALAITAPHSRPSTLLVLVTRRDIITAHNTPGYAAFRAGHSNIVCCRTAAAGPAHQAVRILFSRRPGHSTLHYGQFAAIRRVIQFDNFFHAIRILAIIVCLAHQQYTRSGVPLPLFCFAPNAITPGHYAPQFYYRPVRRPAQASAWPTIFRARLVSLPPAPHLTGRASPQRHRATPGRALGVSVLARQCGPPLISLYSFSSTLAPAGLLAVPGFRAAGPGRHRAAGPGSGRHLALLAFIIRAHQPRRQRRAAPGICSLAALPFIMQGRASIAFLSSLSYLSIYHLSYLSSAHC